MMKKLTVLAIMAIGLSIFFSSACFAKSKNRRVGEIETNYISWEGEVITFYCYARSGIKQIEKEKYSATLFDEELNAIYSEFGEKGKQWVEQVPPIFIGEKPKKFYAIVRKAGLQNVFGAVSEQPYLELIGKKWSKGHLSSGKIRYYW